MSAELGQPGQIIDGKYRVVRLLGTGGMGAVWEGENVRIHRKVAIKLLHSSVSSQPEVVTRFEREAQAAGRIGSEHICEVLDLGVLPDQTRYMVMEYLDGETLSSLIKRNGRLTPQQSIPLLVQMLDALQAAHNAGIVHRDLKPDNVFILPMRAGTPNFIKILDFGVSKFSQSGGDMNVTRAGAVVGTPYYMSPEQARGGGVDARTDVYSIGVVLYQASTGYVPYQAETFNELLFKIVLEVAPPPQTYVPDLDPAFAAIIQKAMAREPEQRFQSCIQFRDALLQFQQARAGAYTLPRFHEDPSGTARTEVIDLGQGQQPRPPNHSGVHNPSGANWPAPQMGGSDGTLPMQPGLQMGANTGPGLQPSPLQSGASWAAASNPGAQPPGAPLQNATGASWGNASSPNAAQRPRNGNGAMIGVVVVAAILGVGVAVGAVVMMKPNKPAPATTSTATSAPVVTAMTSATAPSTTTAATAAPPPTTPQPSTSTSSSAAPADTGTKPSTGTTGTGGTGKAPPPGTGTGVPKPGGTGTAKPSTTKKTGKSGGGNDLGY